ncbi:MAG: hypothetical protein ACOX4N_07375 [Dethiobacteraceae bacterium]
MSLIAGAAILVIRTAISDLTSVAIALGTFALLVLTRLHPILILALSALAGIHHQFVLESIRDIFKSFISRKKNCIS